MMTFRSPSDSMTGQPSHPDSAPPAPAPQRQERTTDAGEDPAAALAELYEHAPLGYLILGPSGRITRINREAARLLRVEQGYPGHFVAFLAREDQNRWSQEIQARREGGGHMELVLQRTDGSRFHARLDYNQGAAQTRVMVTDITERKLAEQSLRESEARFRSLFNASQDAILVVTPDQLLMINEAARKLIGYCDDQLPGCKPLDLFHPDTQMAAAALMKRSLTQEGPVPSAELKLVQPNGSAVDVEASMVSFDCRDGRAIHMVLRDITERKNADRARREGMRERREIAQRLAAMARHLLAVQEEAKRRLARELHDRTSPNLAAIGVNHEMAEMALQERNWGEAEMRMADIRALLDDTTVSIREICADLRPPSLDHAGLLPALESYAGQFTQRTGIAVQLACSGQEIRLHRELETTLFRIIQEALTNIAKHAQARAVDIDLVLDADPLRVEIYDDGIGFAPPPDGMAAGQGLINMRELAEFSGGRFELQSQPGSGTRIRIRLPKEKRIHVPPAPG